MKKSFTLMAAVLLLAITTSKATHIVGGEFSVKWVSGNTFHVTLHFYRDCANGTADFDNPAPMGIYDKVTNVNQQCLSVALTTRDTLKLGDSCYTPNLCVELGTYETDVVIPNNPNGYYISYSRCCRNGLIITNVANPQNAGETWYAEFPNPSLHNSTPVFGPYPKGYFCLNNLNIQDFSCTDADNDSLVYSLVTPINGHTTSNSPNGFCPDPGPYPVIAWNPGYNDTTISGPLTINHQTGILTANPAGFGVFVFCVRVEEWSRGPNPVKLGMVQRDIQYSVLNCTTAAAYPDTTVCPGSKVTLHATGGTKYRWKPTAGLSDSTSANPVVTASVTTTYTVYVTTGSCTSTATVTIKIGGSVNVGITPNGPTTFCDGGSVILTASGASAYSWNTGASTASISATKTNVYTVTGNSGGCTGTASVSVTVNPLPVVTITPGGPTTFCQGGSVTLTASGASSYLWGTGATTSSINASSTNTYSVTGTSLGCKGTASIVVTVNPIPVIAITPGGPTTFCKGGSVKLTASGGTTYIWSPGGATTTAVSVNTANTYTVTGTTNGCSASASQPVAVNSPPVVTIAANGPTTFCQGDSVNLVASGAQTYMWNNGSGGSSIVSRVNQTYYAVGTDANGCKGVSNSITVVVNRLPVPTITPEGPTTFCDGGSVQLCAGGGVNYVWSPAIGTGACVIASLQAHYVLTATNASQCKASTAVDVAVNPLPTVVANPDGPITFCAGGSVNLIASGAKTYVWNPTNDPTTSINVSKTGTFYTVGTDANGCTGTSNTISVIVNPLPTVTIDADGPTTFCEGSSVNLTAGGAATYIWSPGNQTGATLRIASTGSYSTVGTDVNGCTGTSNVIPVLVNPNPTVSIIPQGPTNLCQGGSVQLCASNGSTFSWNNNGGTNQCFTAMNPASYIVTISDANGCTAVSDPLVVTVKAPPIVIADVIGQLTCIANSVTITANSCVVDTSVIYNWSGPGNFTSTLQCASASAVGTYTVVASNGCPNTATTTVSSNITTPTVTATGGTINCFESSLQLMASSSMSGVTYGWTGPNGFTSAQQNPVVSDSGTYIITVTDPTNGCTGSATAHVTKLPRQLTGTCGDQGSLTSTFELDGDATTQTFNPPPDDWDLIYNGTSNADYVGFTTDAPSNADNYFYQGTKDIQDITGWNWTTNSVPDKDDILHTGVALYGHLFYFFADRYAINGNSQIGCWLLQDNVQPQNNGTFSGHHDLGDLLVLCNFTNGGAANAPVLFVYEWVGSGGSDGPLNKLSLEDAHSFAIINANTIPSPWPYTPKFGPSELLPPGSFFEGGIDLACLQGGGKFDACFPAFLMETRASQEATAELKDFVLGNIVVNPNGGHRNAQPLSGNGLIAPPAYPNPFSAVSTIQFERTGESAHTTVEVYTLTGKKIAMLFDKDAEAGYTYKVDFDGSKLAAGVYIYRITSGDNIVNGKLVLMKK